MIKVVTYTTNDKREQKKFTNKEKAESFFWIKMKEQSTEKVFFRVNGIIQRIGKP